MSRGFLAVLRHDLSDGWRVPAAVFGVEALAGLGLATGRVRFDEEGKVLLLLAIVATAALAASIPVRRILAEADAPGFLGSRPVGRREALAARAAVAAFDLVVLWAGTAILFRGALRALPRLVLATTPIQDWVDRGLPLALFALGAIAFSSFAAIPSRWVAGAMTGAGGFVLAYGLVDPFRLDRWDGGGIRELAVPFVAGLVALYVLPALALGRADQGARS